MRGFLFFDIDDTLLDDRHATTVAAQVFFAEHRAMLPGPADEFVRRWAEVTARHIDRWMAGECSLQEQRRARLREVWSRPGLSDAEADRIFDDYRRHYEGNARPFPNVRPCLDALAGRPVGIISNGDSTQQRNKLRNVGLLERFRPVVVSGDIGVDKPDPRIFLEAARQAGCAPGECVYVGDRLETDALGSARAGMTGIWLNRAGRQPAPEGVATIQGLDELPRLIEELASA